MKSFLFICLAFLGFATTGLHAQTGLPTLSDALAAEAQTSKLLSALEAAELTASLEGGEQVILLAPTEDAFATLPEGVLEALLEPENISPLRLVLSEHVITDGGQGVPDLIERNGITLGRMIETANGTIYLIDKVILPDGFDPADL